MADEPEPKAWLDTVWLDGSDKPVRVTLEERQGHHLVLRQVDPGESEPARIPIYEGDEFEVMQAVSHIGLHTSSVPGNNADFMFGMRLIPVRREGDAVYARTLRYGEADSGERVHVRPGGKVVVESATVELEYIDSLEQATESGYVPVTAVLWTWFSVAASEDPAMRLYVLAAARRLDMANQLLLTVRSLENEVNTSDLGGLDLRRRLLLLIGSVELAVVALGRALIMVTEAPARLGYSGAIPHSIVKAYPGIKAIRDAYEHVEERSFGMSFGRLDDRALTIFDYEALLRDDTIVYGPHRLNLVTEVPQILLDARGVLKAIAGRRRDPEARQTASEKVRPGDAQLAH